MGSRFLTGPCVVDPSRDTLAVSVQIRDIAPPGGYRSRQRLIALVGTTWKDHALV